MTADKYTFIHVPKTGGLYVKALVKKAGIGYVGHSRNTARNRKMFLKNYKNPIVIFREPFDRFLSSYNYWKNGFDLTTRRKTKKNTENAKKWCPNPCGLDEFIELLANEPKELFNRRVWDVHVLPQTQYWKDVDYKKVTVVRYSKNLGQQLNKLFEKIEIDFEVEDEKLNVTNKEVFELNKKQKDFVRKFYKDDFVLWEKINKDEQAFSLVV